MAAHVSVTVPVDGLGGGEDGGEVDGGVDGGVEGGVEGGLDGGGAVTTGVAGCNRLEIAEFLSTFAADLEPPDTGAEPLPAEAAE